MGMDYVFDIWVKIWHETVFWFPWFGRAVNFKLFHLIFRTDSGLQRIQNRNYSLNIKIIVQSHTYQPVTRISLRSDSGSNLTFIIAASKWNCKLSIFHWCLKKHIILENRWGRIMLGIELPYKEDMNWNYCYSCNKITMIQIQIFLPKLKWLFLKY